MDFNSSFRSNAELETVTKADLQELRADIQNMNEKIIKEHQTTQKILKRVLEEVKSNASKKNTLPKPILPKEPFKKVEEFMEFERRIQSSENKFNDLVYELSSMVCCNSSRFIKMVWRKIINDCVAKNFCWKGTKDKTAIRALSTTAAIKLAYNTKFTVSTDDDFERTNMTFFQQANNRLIKKKDSKKTSVQNNDSLHTHQTKKTPSSEESSINNSLALLLQ